MRRPHHADERLGDQGFESSRASGTCGTCRLAVLDGEVEHRDSVLTGAERLRSLAACVSRARSPEIVVGPYESEDSE